VDRTEAIIAALQWLSQWSQTYPLAGAACIMQMAQKMMQYQASGVKLKLAAP
jgi:hypothetical protein